MKKTVILSFLLFFGAYCISYAATTSKASVLKDFFTKHGADITQKWAHPVSKYHPEKTIITTTENSATLTLHFNLLGNNYSCEYYVILNDQNYFTTLSVLQEGATNHPSFSSCDNAIELQNKIKIYKGDKELVKLLETVLHKGISAFSFKDYCLLGINFYWKAYKYRTNYLAQGK